MHNSAVTERKQVRTYVFDITGQRSWATRVRDIVEITDPRDLNLPSKGELLIIHATDYMNYRGSNSFAYDANQPYVLWVSGGQLPQTNEHNQHCYQALLPHRTEANHPFWRGVNLLVETLRKEATCRWELLYEDLPAVHSEIHELRHNALSPFLPLSNSLQAFFAAGEFQTDLAFLLLDSASEDYYRTLKDKCGGCHQLIRKMLSIECTAEDSPHRNKTAQEGNPSWAQQIEQALLRFIQDPDLKLLCELLACPDFDKHPDEKGNPQPSYHKLVDKLREFGGRKAHRLIEGIQVLSRNLQKVVDYVERGETAPPEDWGSTP